MEGEEEVIRRGDGKYTVRKNRGKKRRNYWQPGCQYFSVKFTDLRKISYKKFSVNLQTP